MSRVGGAARVPAAAAAEPNWGKNMASWPAECATPADVARRAALSREDFALVKVDTEGAEVGVLAALAAWLDGAARRPALIVELHRTFWSAPAADARAVAAALGAWKYCYRSADDARRHKVGVTDFVPLDAAGAVARTGTVCAEEYCEVLCTDEPFDWAADGALLAGVAWGQPLAGEEKD